jgi:non-heme chloroperoxidase
MSDISAIKVRGVRVVAHDRRGRDRSSQTSSGNNKATLVAHSTGGEPARYIGRHVTKRVAGTVLRWRKVKESKDVHAD